MAFKMNYSFEGNTKSRPEQNLSGSSKKFTKDTLLERTHEERRKRQEQRRKLQSAEVLQSYIRSYICRKYKKDEERQIFQQIVNVAPIRVLLQKLLFFYYPQQDKHKLFGMAEKIIMNQESVIQQMKGDLSFLWLMKRYLFLCLKTLREAENNVNLINSLYIFTNNAQILEYLIRKDYYGYLRQEMETNSNIDNVILLIEKPFKYLQDSESLNNIALAEFCQKFLIPTITNKVQNNLINHLRNVEFPYDRLIKYLNSGFHFQSSKSLLLCVLLLEPNQYEPNLDSLQVLSKLSSSIHDMSASLHNSNKADSDDEFEYDETDKENQFLLNEYMNILNRYDKVKKLFNFFDHNCDNEQVITAFTHLCHNLLLVYKDAVRKYFLLYKMGLNSTYLRKLWTYLNSNQTSQLQDKGSLISWRETHIYLAVFCDMFTFYTETLTDKENSDTSETFSPSDLLAMSKLLKNVAKNLIEVAFPMCRSGGMASTPEIHHLYRACLSSLRMLYMLDLRKQFCPAGFWTSEKIHIPPVLSKKSYLFRNNSSFMGGNGSEERNTDEDEPSPPLSTIEQRSLSILEELPFLINFNTRVLLLRDLCRNSLGESEYQILHNDLINDSVVVIRRTHLYEDAFDKISSKSDADLKHRVRIVFINHVGLEEVGIDGGGIFKEFINEVLKTAFDPNRGFFTLTADNTLYPNPNVHLIVDNFTDHYYFIGRLVGKAIFENILVDLPLAEFFLAKLLVDRAAAHYLKSLDPVLYRNLLYLRDYKGDISDLGLDFTAVSNDLGETKITELKPGGANISVTNENRLEYIQRLADLKLNWQLKKQCNAFRLGLNSVVPISLLKLFSHRELQVIIGGDTQEIDLSDLSAHTLYGGEFKADHPTIILFWKILHRFTDVQKKQLLKFATSCSRPPLLGFKELNPQFCIQSSGTENRMPTASTCLNLLKIPIINDEETLRNKLLAAIEQQAGFELS